MISSKNEKLMLSRSLTERLEAITKNNYIYNDMRRIRIEALLLYIKK